MILALFLALRQRQSQNLHGSRRHKSRLCEHKKERQNTKEQDSKPARRVRVLYCPPYKNLETAMVSGFFFIPKTMFSLIFSLTAQKTRTSAGTGPLKTRLFLCYTHSICGNREKVNPPCYDFVQFLAGASLHSISPGISSKPQYMLITLTINS